MITMENYKGFEITVYTNTLDSVLPIKVYNKELNLGSMLHIEGGQDFPEELLENIIRQVIDEALEKPERWKLKWTHLQSPSPYDLNIMNKYVNWPKNKRFLWTNLSATSSSIT